MLLLLIVISTNHRSNISLSQGISDTQVFEIVTAYFRQAVHGEVSVDRVSHAVRTNGTGVTASASMF